MKKKKKIPEITLCKKSLTQYMLMDPLGRPFILICHVLGLSLGNIDFQLNSQNFFELRSEGHSKGFKVSLFPPWGNYVCSQQLTYNT